MRETRRKATALLAGLQLMAAAALAQSPGVERLIPGAARGPRQRLRVGARSRRRAPSWRICSPASGAPPGPRWRCVTLPTIDDQDEAEVALAIGRKWGVGATRRGRRPAAQRGLGAAAGAAAAITSRAPGTSGSRWGRGSRGSSPTRPAGRSAAKSWARCSRRRSTVPRSQRRPRAHRPHRPRLRRHRFDARARPAARRVPGARLAALLAPAVPALHRVRHDGQSGRTRGAGYIGGAAPGLVAAGRGRRIRRWWRVRRRRWVRWLRRRWWVQRRWIRRTVLMHETVDRVVTPFLAAADAALGAGYSALLYGSAARGDYLPGRSNINLLLVLDDASPTRLRALAPAFAAWRKAASEPPASHQPGRVGAGVGRVPDRDHGHARRLPGASRGRSAGRRSRSGRRSPAGARARAAGQAAPAPPGLRGGGRRREAAGRGGRGERRRPSSCCCARC